eukprot:gene20822-biopygen96218
MPPAWLLAKNKKVRAARATPISDAYAGRAGRECCCATQGDRAQAHTAQDTETQDAGAQYTGAQDTGTQSTGTQDTGTQGTGT